ncbi:prepilin-type N-terminal cleavage/methylation domain-containing protein [Kutzneria buriramensis]|uniref:Pilin/secretion family protein with methylation motif n=1 Tax=Kutzneria buriramensis TaxID=1045776 RepID=A0A3E0GXL0_9PSEU|nr:prepilin-type N-terminal cleavage/methylation domain-containing protein [Kutzneria buriramensis]REH33132.1 pilin/secretion family protein with methylation motif [Kutzneria buriramensis]
MTDERGETLLELLIAVVIMAVAVVAVVGALVNSIQLSDVHRKQATASAAVRDYGEAITNAVDGGGYVSCAGPSSYGTGFTPPAGYTKSVGSVKYWDGAAWQTTCGADTGLQQVTIQVASADGRASEQLVVVVRKPCGLSDSPCA